MNAISPGRIAPSAPAPPGQAPGKGDERRLIEVCALLVAAALDQLASSPTGLTSQAAAQRLAEYGPNELARSRHLGFWADIFQRCRGPLVIQLLPIATVSGVIGELKST